MKYLNFDLYVTKTQAFDHSNDYDHIKFSLPYITKYEDYVAFRTFLTLKLEGGYQETGRIFLNNDLNYTETATEYIPYFPTIISNAPLFYDEDTTDTETVNIVNTKYGKAISFDPVGLPGDFYMYANGANYVFYVNAGAGKYIYLNSIATPDDTRSGNRILGSWSDYITDGQTINIPLIFNNTNVSHYFFTRVLFYDSTHEASLLDRHGVVISAVRPGGGASNPLPLATQYCDRLFAVGEDLFTESDYPEPVEDPFDPGGTSGGGGGNGNFDGSSDTVPVPALPSISGLETGFFTAFMPSASEMRSVSSYLWNNLIQDILDHNQTIKDKIEALKDVIANPYDAIMGCSIVPVKPTKGGSKELKMYGIIETGEILDYASSRWVEVDCGTLNINEYWGAYLDYSPYTKTTSLYLPYVGTVSIDIDMIMGKTLGVVYHVDILTGICIAYITIDGSVQFQYQGHCATTIPVTNADYSSAIQAGLGLVGNVANIVKSTGTGLASGGVAGAVMGAVSGAVSQAPSIAGNVMNAKPDIKSGGGIGGAGGLLSGQKPYLIIERPKQSLPENQNTFTGYPANVTKSFGDCRGYTEFEDIKLENIPLTPPEIEELKRILQGGVYL